MGVQVADISMREAAEMSSLQYLVERFPCLLPIEEEGGASVAEAARNTAQDNLEAEFLDYQCWDMPSHPKSEEMKLEEQWTQITKVQDCNGAIRFVHVYKHLQT